MHRDRRGQYLYLCAKEALRSPLGEEVVHPPNPHGPEDGGRGVLDSDLRKKEEVVSRNKENVTSC